MVTVAVRGLPDGIKFFVSECLTPVAANHNGCGPQLAQQPFGVSDNAGKRVRILHGAFECRLDREQSSPYVMHGRMRRGGEP